MTWSENESDECICPNVRMCENINFVYKMLSIAGSKSQYSQQNEWKGEEQWNGMKIPNRRNQFLSAKWMAHMLCIFQQYVAATHSSSVSKS